MKFVLSAIFLLAASVIGLSQTTKYKDNSEVPRITLEDAKKAFDEQNKQDRVQCKSLPKGSHDDDSDM